MAFTPNYDSLQEKVYKRDKALLEYLTHKYGSNVIKQAIKEINKTKRY